MRVTVLGGGVAGLSAAETAAEQGNDVVLIDDQGFESKEQREGAWGEFIHNYRDFPREGDVPGVNRFPDEVQLLRVDDGDVASKMVFDAPEPVVIDRAEFEVAWANEISDAVDVRDRTSVDASRYMSLAEESDLLIDATGPDPISAEAVDKVSSCGKSIVTLSASMEGDFSNYWPGPAVVTWSEATGFINTKSRTQATFGLGWYQGYEPDDPVEVFEEFCDNLEIPSPQSSEIIVGREPVQDSRDFSECAFELEGCDVRLAGDACGLVNGINNFGNVRSARSGSKSVTQSPEEYVNWLKSETKVTGREQFFAKIQEIIGSDTFVKVIGTDGRVLNERAFCEPRTNTEILKNIARFGASAIRTKISRE